MTRAMQQDAARCGITAQRRVAASERVIALDMPNLWLAGGAHSLFARAVTLSSLT